MVKETIRENLLDVLIVSNDGLSTRSVTDLCVGHVTVRVGPWTPKYVLAGVT